MSFEDAVAAAAKATGTDRAKFDNFVAQYGKLTDPVAQRKMLAALDEHYAKHGQP